MSIITEFKYSECLFEARLQKPNVFRFRKKEQFYLYVSPDCIIINREPYSKKPEIVLKILSTTHVKWLWEHRKSSSSVLKGFIIETEGYMNEFVAEKIVLQTLKTNFKQIALQSDFNDEYILGHYLDKGNYAQVYSCNRRDNGMKYAVKILEKQRLKVMKNGKESVFNQLKILRALNHQNLLKLYQVYEDRNKFYLVLELLQGITLCKEIKNRKKTNEFKPFQIRGIIKQILQGLAHLHGKNIMHRDVKPENILFQNIEDLETSNAEKGLRLVDYGLATYQSDKNIVFTKCGTPGFVAPEIISYDEKDPIYPVIVDMFSVGVILHILLVGEQPFSGSRNTILNKNKECRLDFKSKKYEGIATDGIDLLSKMLEKTSQKRISADYALTHPFLTMDRPIFKLKKTQRESKHIKIIPMKEFRNLQDFKEDVSNSAKTRRDKQGQQIDSAFCPFDYDVQQISSHFVKIKLPQPVLRKLIVPTIRGNPSKQIDAKDFSFEYRW